MWEKVYQSKSCCDVSGESGLFSQNRIVPQVQIGGRPHRQQDGDLDGEKDGDAELPAIQAIHARP